MLTTPPHATMVASLPCVKTTTRGRVPLALGIFEIARAMAERSSPSPFSLPYVSASDSLAKRKSTNGITCPSGSLKNWMMNGAERLRQNVLPLAATCSPSATIVAGETVRKKPAQ